MKDKKIKFAIFIIYGCKPEYINEQNWLRKHHKKGWELVKIKHQRIYFFRDE